MSNLSFDQNKCMNSTSAFETKATFCFFLDIFLLFLLLSVNLVYIISLGWLLYYFIWFRCGDVLLIYSLYRRGIIYWHNWLAKVSWWYGRLMHDDHLWSLRRILLGLVFINLALTCSYRIALIIWLSNQIIIANFHISWGIDSRIYKGWPKGDFIIQL